MPGRSCRAPTASWPGRSTFRARRGAARAVGQALGRNPFAIIVPCHRVTAAGGKLGGFSADGGVRTKRALLAAESAGSGSAVGPRLPSDVALDIAAALERLHETDTALAHSIEATGPPMPALKPTH
jgi:methylated-DNA-[protein]-cysteine S-methyltransferase